ncbi:MAG: KTSC domain-containing protein [Actinobacteria bacterium]|nr:KTSC domain-containing protein [Actinomycetota bacterium]
MIRHCVSSSDIVSIGFDSESQILEIEFKSGGVYQYYRVSENTYRALIGASSIGRYFHQYIQGRYDDTKVI